MVSINSTILAFSAILVLVAAVSASPIREEAERHKRDLMIETDEDGLRELFGDDEQLSRKRRDLMIEGDEDGDFGRWLLENFDSRDQQSNLVDELPIGKRSVSPFAGAASAGAKYYPQKKSSNGGKKKSIYIWFPDDTKHARRPHNQMPTRNQHQQQKFRLSDTFKFMN